MPHLYKDPTTKCVTNNQSIILLAILLQRLSRLMSASFSFRKVHSYSYNTVFILHTSTLWKIPTDPTFILQSVTCSVRSGDFTQTSLVAPNANHYIKRDMPDLNSLPPSRHPNHTNNTMSNHGDLYALRGQSPSPSPRAASTSLQAAAAVNAGLQSEQSSG